MTVLARPEALEDRSAVRRVNELAFERSENPYRTGGARVAMATVRQRLRAGINTLEIQLG